MWFVNNIRWVNNADEEIRALDSINPKTTAVIKKMYQKDVPESLNSDTTATIKLVKYRPNHLIYETDGSGNRLAIFSEIYYKDGWNAYIDGELSSYLPADYILRGMIIPAGKHTIEFRFEPGTYKTGRKISMASSAVLALFVIGILLFEGRKRLKQQKA
ncbi:MAG: YfhO family protein [Bacteroidetes bacterium]|nr:YfhO family protein [Bacteroidota bacterium]